MENIKVRYGPSPTGIPHIGNIRTALFNFLFAKSKNGQFFLRIEDTDRTRIVPGAVEKIQQSLKLLGLHSDGEIIYQSKRLEIYKKHLEILKEKKLAYEDEGAWRFKISTRSPKIGWQDLVHGQVEFPTNVLEDFIIVKSDGFPTYHFASVVDDHLMEISHVIRGDEWISSTPKHILLYEAFTWQHPQFVHLPPILGADHKKLSKRDGAKSIMEYIDEGYLPEALINFMVLLGWSPKGNQEIFSLDQLCKEFSLERINKNSPIFNIEKLNWFNGQWIRKIPDNKLIEMINNKFPQFDKSKIADVLPIVKDRLITLLDFEKISSLFFQKPDTKSHLSDISISKNVLEDLISELEEIDKWDEQIVSEIITAQMDKENLSKAQMYKSLGIAISGELVTPPIFAAIEVLGKAETIKRLKSALKLL